MSVLFIESIKIKWLVATVTSGKNVLFKIIWIKIIPYKKKIKCDDIKI